MPPTKNALNSMLVEVRTSYRLLASYQRRVLDLSREAAQALDPGLEFFSWRPSLFNTVPQSGSNPVDRWAWDYLPLYDFSMIYKRNAIHWDMHEPNDWILCVRTLVDSGFETDGFEPDPASFVEAAKCESYLRLYVYQYTQESHGNWLYQTFDQNPWPSANGLGTLGGDLRTFGATFPLSDCADPHGLQRCVGKFSNELKEALPVFSEILSPELVEK